MASLVTRVICFFLITSQGVAHACSISGAVPSDLENFASATAVFVAHVTGTAESPNKTAEPQQPIIEGSFRLIEVLKGKPPSNNIIRTVLLDPKDCAFVVIPGLDYLFFMDGHGFVRALAGSRPLPPEPERARILQPLRNSKQKAVNESAA